MIFRLSAAGKRGWEGGYLTFCSMQKEDIVCLRLLENWIVNRSVSYCTESTEREIASHLNSGKPLMLVGIILCLLLSHFPLYACFWILIATTGALPLICIMNCVIIPRPLLRNKHVICPHNEFDSLLCNWTPLVSSKRGLYFHTEEDMCVKISLFFFSLPPSCLSCMCFHAWAASVRHVFVHTFCASLCIFMDAQLPAQTWHLAACSFEEQRKLERPKIPCGNWTGFIFSLIN